MDAASREIANTHDLRATLDALLEDLSANEADEEA
jgi:hypothetical protein